MVIPTVGRNLFSASKLHLKYLKTIIYTLLVYVRKRQSLRYFEILNPHLQSVNSGLKFQKAFYD